MQPIKMLIKCVREITQSSETTCDFLLDFFDFYCLI